MNLAIAGGVVQVASGPERQEHRKLTDAAQQFEGMLLEELLKPMKEHGFAQQDGDDGSQDAGDSFSDTLSSFGSETLATALAKSGGLGIARLVVEQVEREKAEHAPQQHL